MKGGTGPEKRERILAWRCKLSVFMKIRIELEKGRKRIEQEFLLVKEYKHDEDLEVDEQSGINY